MVRRCVNSAFFCEICSFRMRLGNLLCGIFVRFGGIQRQISRIEILTLVVGLDSGGIEICEKVKFLDFGPQASKLMSSGPQASKSDPHENC